MNKSLSLKGVTFEWLKDFFLAIHISLEETIYMNKGVLNMVHNVVNTTLSEVSVAAQWDIP